MNMLSCTRKIEFDAGHRVIGHQNKCQYLHGHRYVLEITAIAPELNKLGMVVDFGELKQLMKGWIDENLDHNVILSNEDKQLGELIMQQTGQHIYYLSANPTAENIAKHLMQKVVPELFKDRPYQITKLKLYETPNAFVEIYEQ